MNNIIDNKISRLIYIIMRCYNNKDNNYNQYGDYLDY